MITAALLMALSPRLPVATAGGFALALDAAAVEYEITSLAQQAAWTAQLAHESAGYQFLQEIWGPTPAQMHYDPASGSVVSMRLGNTRIGDGYRYRGRGWIQLTGRGNYRKAGVALGLDLEANPDLAARPDVAARIAGWYWTTHGWKDATGRWWPLPELAEAGMFRQVTLAINGGLNGLDSRYEYLDRALKALSGQQPSTGAGRVFLRALDGTNVLMVDKQTIYNDTRVTRHEDGAVSLERVTAAAVGGA